MNYILNPSAMQSVFMMPGDAVRAYLKLASAEQLRVLIFTMSNISSGIDPELCARELGIPADNVLDALNFWCEAGVFSKNQEITFDQAPEKRSVAKVAVSKPSREEIAMMGQTDEKISFLLREAELKFNRPLRFAEMQSLVSLYADDSMDVSLIIMLVEYAISEGKKSIGFINKTAQEWLNAGVDSVVAAEEQIEKLNSQRSAWSIVEKAFGIEHRQPSAKELEYSEKWIIDWGFSREMLKAAYDSCVDSKAKLSMPYINKILESWHQKGFKTVEETKTKPKSTERSENKPSYDIDLFEKMINRKD